MFDNTIWVNANCDVYLPRCGKCGSWRKEEELRQHWFFNGLYCVSCIQDVLYDNARIMVVKSVVMLPPSGAVLLAELRVL